MAAGTRVWLDDKFVSYGVAKVPILTHSMQYGSGAFEGIRAYPTKDGPAVFRLDDHIARLFRTIKIYSMPMKYTPKIMHDAVVKLVKINKMDSCYIRPYIFYNSQDVGVGVYGKKTSVYVATVPLGSYYGAAKEKGLRCKISSWRRINSSILPVEAKSSGNYNNSIIASNEAKASGFDEAILLSTSGYVAEGPADNVFIVKDGHLITPDASADILMGITRDSLIQIAESIGLIVEQREVHKEELYSSDEAFFCGTAAEVTPVVNIDGITVGNGKPGPITRLLSQKYDSIVRGEDKLFKDWLTYV